MTASSSQPGVTPLPSAGRGRASPAPPGRQRTALTVKERLILPAGCTEEGRQGVCVSDSLKTAPLSSPRLGGLTPNLRAPTHGPAAATASLPVTPGGGALAFQNLPSLSTSMSLRPESLAAPPLHPGPCGLSLWKAPEDEARRCGSPNPGCSLPTPRAPAPSRGSLSGQAFPEEAEAWHVGEGGAASWDATSGTTGPHRPARPRPGHSRNMVMNCLGLRFQ